MDTSYTVDRSNRIMSVGGNWDAFACENGGQSAVAQNVIGGILFDFVEGFDTASVLNAVLFSVRSKQRPCITTYRCDSQVEKRLFRMHVAPLLHGGIRVHHQLLSWSLIADQPRVRPLNSEASDHRCSVCCKVQVGEKWIDLFSQPNVAYSWKSHTVCPGCKAAICADIGERVKGELNCAGFARG
ncbi:hypothetical protein [Cognatishimia sp. F0-27]|uniref:hypothetical protein n=1 Tax=Cognatishimia sp. F0-27 TaxID=2816855 RepID=UPI001D0C0948|nr:hypothetical protein [Cognatishimia sp. F0-27]MCC1495063.1 hypothetical protein [Cognatishimia sp. F0-27]